MVPEGSSPQFVEATAVPADINNDPFSPESQKAQLLVSQGEELIERLTNCPLGTPGWQEFEVICFDILSFCLRDEMESFNISRQGTTWDRHQRMDIIVKNRPFQNLETGYWNRLITAYNAESIVFECKNKESGIKKEEILQAKDYELPEFGKFRVILTRKLPDPKGILAIRHWFIYEPKMRIVVFTEEDLIRLVQSKIGVLDETISNVFYSLQDNERDSWYR
jgi:hypothetical protein